METVDSDNRVRLAVYRHVVQRERVPRMMEVALALGQSADDVRAALQRLASAKILVLQEDGEILMAEPFSAVPTGFEVEVGGRRWWGNCIWDALGCVAALAGSGRVSTACGCCGFAMQVEVRDRKVLGEGIGHFALPARDWWKDVVFT